MGILRDTYIINDNKGLRTELKISNQIAEKQLEFEKDKFEQELATKDRVDISLNEYENLKKELKSTKESLSYYRNFFEELGKSIRTNPEVLLKSKVVKTEVGRIPLTMKNNLYVIFELEDSDVK